MQLPVLILSYVNPRWDAIPQNKADLIMDMKKDMFDPIQSIYHVHPAIKCLYVEAHEHLPVDVN